MGVILTTEPTWDAPPGKPIAPPVPPTWPKRSTLLALNSRSSSSTKRCMALEGDGRKPKTAPKNRLGYRSLMYPYEKSPFRCFLKWWYPQIIHLNRVFHYKPSILGYHHFRKHPCKPQNFVGIYVWNNPQESHPRTSHRYHVYTARGTPNCPLILKPLQMALYICFYGVLG